MNQQLIAEIGRTQRLQILNTLKRTKGMSVNELVAKMGMSYMGIKQHCLTLERDGYLDTWRRPQKMGRPEMVYRLTKRTHDLFPCDSNDFTLEVLKSVADIYGPSAPEKLLYSVFERKSAKLKEKVKGQTVNERAKWLVEQREKEGFMSDYVDDPKLGPPHILECHTPIMNLVDKYPLIQKLEQDLISNVLGTKVRREESRASGLYECVFYFDSESKIDGTPVNGNGAASLTN
ncbi:MAG: helix-turn-helix transcriptional regulator [Chthoniobacterales bacterium]